MPIVDKLRGFRVLNGFTLQQLAALAGEGDEREAKKGEVLFKEKDDPKDLIFLLDGKMEIRANGNLVAEVPPGSLVGEMGVLRNEPRTGSLVAAVDSFFLSLSGDDFLRLTESDPDIGRKFYKNLSLILMDQLKKNNLLVEFFNALGK